MMNCSSRTSHCESGLGRNRTPMWQEPFPPLVFWSGEPQGTMFILTNNYVFCLPSTNFAADSQKEYATHILDPYAHEPPHKGDLTHNSL